MKGMRGMKGSHATNSFHSFNSIHCSSPLFWPFIRTRDIWLSGSYQGLLTSADATLDAAVICGSHFRGAGAMGAPSPSKQCHHVEREIDEKEAEDPDEAGDNTAPGEPARELSGRRRRGTMKQPRLRAECERPHRQEEPERREHRASRGREPERGLLVIDAESRERREDERTDEPRTEQPDRAPTTLCLPRRPRRKQECDGVDQERQRKDGRYGLHAKGTSANENQSRSRRWRRGQLARCSSINVGYLVDSDNAGHALHAVLPLHDRPEDQCHEHSYHSPEQREAHMGELAWIRCAAPIAER